MEKYWHIYLLECKDGSYYTGITNDVSSRMKKHALGKGSKYVKAKGFKQLIKSKKCKDKSEALKLELKIKKLSRNEKINYFRKNFN